MTKRATSLGLLMAGSCLSSVAAAQSAPTPPPTSTPAPSAPPVQTDQDAIIITAQKREENLQDVPVSVQALGTRKLDQLNISNFEDYTKQLPSVSFQTSQPGSTVVYMRGVATGGDGNHSGSLPSVGTYLDEQPVTTIGGTLDVHIYDIARIESLAGPQGTLYGASSQAGTIRIITNKPNAKRAEGRLDLEVNKIAGGDRGSKLEGMVNVPIGKAERVALRAIASYKHNGGYIDNVAGTRTYLNPGGAPFVSDNRALVERNFNDLTTYGARAALQIDLDEHWTVTPTVMHQNLKTNGVFFMDAD